LDNPLANEVVITRRQGRLAVGGHVSGDFKFADNSTDLSQQSGPRAGFQFDFRCEHCGDTWRSDFVAFKQGQASEWLGRASGFLGGALGGVSDVVGEASAATWGSAHDKAFQQAIEAAKDHFHRCPRCTNYVCDQCWNEAAGLCVGCAPSAEVEIEAAKASGMVYAAGEKAALEGIQQGKKMDVKRDRQLVCPQCGAPNNGAKFCPECGAKLSDKKFCTECGGEIPAGAKFCPDCGAQAAAQGS
jgi:membrane protease subunit (stomatin/prohibitin family)